MDSKKGKPVTTSVPSISIRFHANAEQLEELYASDDESSSSVGATCSATATSESESSPLRYLPRLVRRSTSIDITPTTVSQDASPPSDPWRFFSDIKGKITKSVEDKITEIKARNQDEGSPFKSAKANNNKDSSLSDSEDISESSISKTCGLISTTTEGAEMSSDDDTSSVEKDKKIEGPVSGGKCVPVGLRQRFLFLKSKNKPKEGTISTGNLSRIYNINADKIEQALPEDSEIESGVDALADENWQKNLEIEDKVLKNVTNKYDNIKVDKNKVVNIKEVQGHDMKHIHWVTKLPKTVYAPVGFVDMRGQHSVQNSTYLPFVMLSVLILLYALVHSHSTYWAGIIVGVILTYVYFTIKNLLVTPSSPQTVQTVVRENILEIPAVKEYQPLNKYEGWLNELPETYNPYTYHISQTQSVYLRLQGNLLRVSHARNKVPKRALWNEAQIKPIFTHHRIYNLLGAKVSILPEGLAKRKHWSKKYPICVALNKDQLNFESPTDLLKEEGDQEEERGKVSGAKSRSFHLKKKGGSFVSQRFSKLTEEDEDYAIDSDNSRASTPSPTSPDTSEPVGAIEDPTQKLVQQSLDENLSDENADETESLNEDWGTFTPDDSPTETRLYLFGRTDREKEDWFRRFTAATHRGADLTVSESLELHTVVSDTLVTAALSETDYIKYMLIFNKTNKKSSDTSADTSSLDSSNGEIPVPDILWMNAFVGRILFDCLRDETFTKKVIDRIQRKLTSIKLPYFIEEVLVTDLSLGQTPPLIHKASRPIIDERGLWIDIDISYEGLILLTIQTKLNLMKLKQPHEHDKINTERPAMFHSDIDDSAESTSDEDSMPLIQNAAPLDQSGIPVPGLGGSSNASKRFIKMVDRIAESKFFQVASENKYIKKAMEEVSNTDLRLRVEVSKLIGTVVLNIPPPPSDRVWIGFRPTPVLGVVAQPIVGERNITFLRVTTWIEKKLQQEFQKLLVIPNMEDIMIPVMNQKLPE